MTTRTETWLDIIPAIRNDHAVPMRNAKQRRVVGICSKLHGALCIVCKGHQSTRFENWRVDLGDPQGFGYALTAAFRSGGHGLAAEVMIAMWTAHARGGTTDADRLSLAKALREVTS